MFVIVSGRDLALWLWNGWPASGQIPRTIGGGSESAEMMRPVPDQQPDLGPVAQAHFRQRKRVHQFHSFRLASLHKLEV